jgi:hypothetical protein
VLTLLGLILLLVAGHWGAGRRAASGLEGELAAYRAAGEPTTVEELNRWDSLRSGSGENAVPLLRAAGTSIDAGSAAWRSAIEPLYTPPLTADNVAQLAGILERHSDGLAKVDEAAGKGLIDWQPRYKSPVMQNLLPSTDLSDLRTLEQLLKAAAVVAHYCGDDAEALKRIEQMLFAAEALDHQPLLIYHLVASAIGTQATRTAVEIAPELRVGGEGGVPRQRLEAFVTRLLDERPLREGQRRAWVGERVMQLDLPNNLFGPGAGGGTFGGFNLRIPGMGFAIRPLVLDNTRAMARCTTALLHAMAESPDLPTFRSKTTDLMPEAKRSPRRYAIASALMPAVAGKLPESHYRALADRRLAATCLAVRLYALDHGGKLPRRLEDLVPRYLPSVPLDPLASGGQPLRYANDSSDPQRPRVYSVGVDGDDDGGKEGDPAAPGADAKNPDEVRYLSAQPPVNPGQ